MEREMAKGEGRHGDQEKTQEASISSNTMSEMAVKKGREKEYKVPFYMLFSFADATDVFLMTLGSIGALGHGATIPVMTVLFGKMIQSFGGAQDPEDVLHRVSEVAIQYVYLAVGAGISSFLQVTCWIATGERQVARIRSLYLKAILKQEIAFFDKETTTGEVVERVSGDTVIIHDAMGERVGKFIQIMTASTGCIIVAFIKGWLLSLIMMSMIPLGMICGGLVSVFVSKMASKAQKAYSEAAVVVEQAIGSIKTVASFTGENRSVKEYDIALIKAYKSSIYEGIATGLGLGMVTFLMFCGYSLGVWFGGHLILNEDKGYTGAKVINVIFSVLMGCFFLGQGPPCTTAFAAGQAAAYNMFEAINRKPKIDAFDPKARVLPDIKGDIDFKNVYFRYPSREEQIFRGFSLSIKQGTTTALIGESGSGKSTVISLIERFYDPQAGDVLIDGVKINELQLRWLRSKIGLVSQEPILFASSIRDNVAYGKDNATIEEIQLATDSANASRFIDNMPQGLDTMVGAFGTQLSGGQKQRIAIARAILKDPRILLLDEATSALDTESERTVQEALDRVMKKRTTIVVAHRLSTVRNADSIAVLRHGSIVEKGSHIELVQDPNGAYSQLLRLQEMNQTSDSMSHKGSPLANSPILSNQEISSKLFISREFSSEIIGSPHPASLELGSHVRVDSKGNALVEPTSGSAELPKEVPLSRLASLNKPEIPILLLGTASAIIHGLVFPVFGVLLSKVIRALYQPPDLVDKDSKFWSLMFLLFGFVSLIALPSRSFYFAVAGSRLIRRIRLMTFQKVINMEMAWFDEPENSSGAVGARLSTDAAIVRNLLGDALGLAVHNITILVAGLAIAFASNLKLSLIILVMLPFMCLNGWIQMKSMRGFSRDAKKMYEQASQVANDAVSSIRTVASLSAEEKVVELYQKKCEGPTRKGIRQGVISGIGFGVSSSLIYCAYAASFYAGARLVRSGETTFGKVFQVFFAFTMAATGISESNSAVPNAEKAKSATASVFAVLDRKSKIDPSDVSGMTLENLEGEIKFRHVSFKYPSRPEVQIFHDLCLSIKSGTTVALVGESGSGKSTAIALLQRFYDPDSGNILLDGIELHKFNLKWLRQQMSWVSQEPALFNDTIRANIAFGIEGNATETEIVAAAKAANAHEFICYLQKGYDTIVGERGVQLSGGQKQRVAIARAILKGSKILLLDEATSALDAESERQFQDAAKQVMTNKTTVTIAHRLNTIKKANLIAVFKDGVIIEKGGHDALIKMDGAYASMATIQSSSSIL